MLEQLEAIRERFLEVEQQIAMPEVVSDLKKFKTLSKEYKDLQKIVYNSPLIGQSNGWMIAYMRVDPLQ